MGQRNRNRQGSLPSITILAAPNSKPLPAPYYHVALVNGWICSSRILSGEPSCMKRKSYAKKNHAGDISSPVRQPLKPSLNTIGQFIASLEHLGSVLAPRFSSDVINGLIPTPQHLSSYRQRSNDPFLYISLTSIPSHVTKLTTIFTLLSRGSGCRLMIVSEFRCKWSSWVRLWSREPGNRAEDPLVLRAYDEDTRTWNGLR
jgi:hypothetical protein